MRTSIREQQNIMQKLMWKILRKFFKAERPSENVSLKQIMSNYNPLIMINSFVIYL